MTDVSTALAAVIFRVKRVSKRQSLQPSLSQDYTNLDDQLPQTCQYLNSRSCHPTHVKRGIPYGQALRVRRICESDEVFKERLKEFQGNLIERFQEESY